MLTPKVQIAVVVEGDTVELINKEIVQTKEKPAQFLRRLISDYFLTKKGGKLKG